MAQKTEKARLRIALTPEQIELIREATGVQVSELELTPETLEERIAPTATNLNSSKSNIY